MYEKKERNDGETNMREKGKMKQCVARVAFITSDNGHWIAARRGGGGALSRDNRLVACHPLTYTAPRWTYLGGGADDYIDDAEKRKNKIGWRK